MICINIYVTSYTYWATGLEPLSFYRFGAIATRDCPLTNTLVQQAREGRLEKLAEEGAEQLCKEMLGTVIMEPDTMSRRLWDYTRGYNKKGNEGEMGRLLMAAIHPGGRHNLMGQVPEGRNFILGVSATYQPGVRGYLEGTNLYLYPNNGRRYSKAELQEAVPGSNPGSVLKSRKGVPIDFPDMRIEVRGDTAEEAHDAVDKMVKAIHGVDGVIYLPLPVETEAAKDSGLREMMSIIDRLEIGSDAQLAKAAQAKNDGGVHLLRDLIKQ